VLLTAAIGGRKRFDGFAAQRVTATRLDHEPGLRKIAQ
jgi:hypothetical protein